MQKKNVKIIRAAAGAVSAILIFSSMNIDVLAKETGGLPSAGIDFILSSDATSVKNLKDEEDEKKKDNASSESGETQATASPTATATVSPTATPEAEEEEETEDKVIEETAIATTTKTIPQMERKLEAKREEEGFKSLVIAKVNDYVNVRSIPSEEGEILGKQIGRAHV